MTFKQTVNIVVKFIKMICKIDISCTTYFDTKFSLFIVKSRLFRKQDTFLYVIWSCSQILKIRVTTK